MRLTSDHVWGCRSSHALLIWLKLSDNVEMILIFIWYFHKKNLRSNNSPQTAHSKCLKTYWLPCKKFILNVQISWFLMPLCHQSVTDIKKHCNIFLYEACVNWETHKRHKVNLVTKRQTGAEIALLKPKISPMRKREFFLKTLKLNDYLANV